MRFLRALRSVAALLAVITFIAALAAPGRAAVTPIPAAPVQWVTDTAGFLSPATVQTLDERLRAYQQQTGHQIIVYVAPTTGDAPIEDWAVRAFKQWKVGRQGLDDGLALFIFTKDRKLRIEVGYGLEATVTDAQASQIIREAIQPELSAGRPDVAVTAGIDRLLETIGGETARAPSAAEAVELSPGVVLILALVAFGLLLLALRNPWTALWLLTNIISGSRGGFGGGGSSSGRGGFSGGGGRSGGGGASGSW